VSHEDDVARDLAAARHDRVGWHDRVDPNMSRPTSADAAALRDARTACGQEHAVRPFAILPSIGGWTGFSKIVFDFIDPAFTHTYWKDANDHTKEFSIPTNGQWQWKHDIWFKSLEAQRSSATGDAAWSYTVGMDLLDADGEVLTTATQAFSRSFGVDLGVPSVRYPVAVTKESFAAFCAVRIWCNLPPGHNSYCQAGVVWNPGYVDS